MRLPRQLNLRQIEAFKAIIENGTVSRGAEVLNISQPAMSKLIAHLEADTGLRLFNRLKGRLAPTVHAMRLYEEIDRIFAGVRQVESAVETIRREEQGRLAIGVMPALQGSFIRRVTMSFLRDRPNVYCSVQSLSSQWVVDRLITRNLDVGLVSARMDNPYVTIEPLLEHPLVCIMPLDHPLTGKRVVEPADLDRLPFVGFNLDTFTGHRVKEMFEAYSIQMNAVLVASAAQTICDFVSAGLGVSLIHPLMVTGLEDRIAIRRFEPEMPYTFQFCFSADNRNARFIEGFAQELRTAAAEVSRAMLEGDAERQAPPTAAIKQERKSKGASDQTSREPQTVTSRSGTGIGQSE